MTIEVVLVAPVRFLFVTWKPLMVSATVLLIVVRWLSVRRAGRLAASTAVVARCLA